MVVWIRSVSQIYWMYVKKYNLWKVKNKLRTCKIEKDDCLLFYVVGTCCFKGIYQVISDWHNSISHDWLGPNNEKDEFNYQIKLKPLFLGEVNYLKLLPNLKFIVRKKSPGIYLQSNPSGVSNFGNPLEKVDYELIKKGMNKVSNIDTLTNTE